MIAIMAALWTLSCGASAPKVTTVKMSVYADIMCACKTSACIDATLDGYKTWIKKDTAAARQVSVGEHVRIMDCAKKAKKVAPKPTGPKKPDTGPPPVTKPPTGERDKLVAAMNKYTKQVCKCTDKACAEAAYKTMTTWATANRERLRSISTDTKAIGLQKRYAACYTKLVDPRPTPTPNVPPRPTTPRPRPQPTTRPRPTL